MRVMALLPTVYAASLVATAAQAQRVYSMGPEWVPPTVRALSMEGPRAVIGITTTGSATNRDTLGVLVASVRSGSPAEKAGIEEGDRIASVNGVSLKLSTADVGDYEMASAMTRRLTRKLDKLKPGDDVDLHVVSSSQTKSVKVKTVAREDLDQSIGRRRDADRATLGIRLATTGTSRDTLGVFVFGVEDGGPAAKAGIEEGARVASINGVDVRGRRAADDDGFLMTSSNINRFEREVSRLKPGDDVDLRVLYNGQYKNVKFKAGRLSDLPRRGRSVMIMGDAEPDIHIGAMMPMPDRVVMERDIGDRVRRALDEARVAVGPVMRAFGNRVSW